MRKILFTIALSTLVTVTCTLAQSTRHRVTLAFTTNQLGGDISTFEILPSGEFKLDANGPFPVSTTPSSIALSPTGRFAYVANLREGTVAGFKVGRTGDLARIAGSPWHSGHGTNFVAVDPSGRFVYATNCGNICSGPGDGDISAFSIEDRRAHV